MSARGHALLQLFLPIENHGDGRRKSVKVLSPDRHIEEESLAVAAHVVLRSGPEHRSNRRLGAVHKPGCKERNRLPDVKSLAGVYRDGHELAGGRIVEELLAVSSPSRVDRSLDRDLTLDAGLWKTSDKNLVSAGLR
jgi:hypothetical protein